MPPLEVRVCYAALFLATWGIGAVVGAIDLAAYAYRLHRNLTRPA
jgi:hypothetical protein